MNLNLNAIVYIVVSIIGPMAKMYQFSGRFKLVECNL